MKTTNIIIDGKNVEIYTSIDKEMIEVNNEVFPKNKLDDTLDLSTLPDIIKEVKKNG